MRTMTVQQMRKRYEEVSSQLVEMVEENRAKDKQVTEEIEKLVQTRELEKKVEEKMRREMRE